MEGDIAMSEALFWPTPTTMKILVNLHSKDHNWNRFVLNRSQPTHIQLSQSLLQVCFGTKVLKQAINMVMQLIPPSTEVEYIFGREIRRSEIMIAIDGLAR